MQKSKIKLFQTAFSIAALIFILFSLIFTTVKSDHNCSGEDCAVCLVINVVKTSLRLFILAAVAATGAVRASEQDKTFVLSAHSQKTYSFSSLFILKTRLND